MTKYYCDRCKSEIGTERSKVYVYEVGDREYELCERCSEELSKWISGEGANEGVEGRIRAQAQEMLIKNFNKWVRE